MKTVSIKFLKIPRIEIDENIDQFLKIFVEVVRIIQNKI